MAYSDAQNARLQNDIDNVLPKFFLQSDALSVCTKLANLFLKDFPSDTDLLSACNGLKYVGQQMDTGEIAADSPTDAHSFIEGIYERGGDGYTQFLRAYAAAYRRWDTLNYEGTDLWGALTNPKTVADAIKSTFKDIGDTVGGLGLNLADVLKWAVVGLIAVLAILIVMRAGAKA